MKLVKFMDNNRNGTFSPVLINPEKVILIRGDDVDEPIEGNYAHEDKYYEDLEEWKRYVKANTYILLDDASEVLVNLPLDKVEEMLTSESVPFMDPAL